MDSRPKFDRSLLIPALIGIFSLLGIILILFIEQLSSLGAPVAETETATPFKYLYLGTEPGISTGPPSEGSAIASASNEPPAPTENTGIPLKLTRTQSGTTVTPSTSNTGVPSLIILLSATRTPTSASTPPLGPGTYDDIDNRLVYSGEWISQTNVSGAQEGTLHVSNTLTNPGNSVTFRFIGQQVIVLYQPASTLGVIRILLDGTPYPPVSESDGSGQRTLTATSAGAHTVTITHVSGGSVNLDEVIIPSVPTPTPTPTSTPH